MWYESLILNITLFIFLIAIAIDADVAIHHQTVLKQSISLSRNKTKCHVLSHIRKKVI